MYRVASALVLVALLTASPFADACISLMGESPDSLAAHPAGTRWNYGLRGDDWDGVDGSNKTWSCFSGLSQSPINLGAAQVTGSLATKGNKEFRTKWQYNSLKANGTNIQVFNNGHTVQIQWPAGEMKSNVRISSAGSHVLDVLDGLKPNNVTVAVATPLQFHFHAPSEHTINGVHFPLELHIVHSIPQTSLKSCPASGCLTVTGVVFALDDNDNDNPILEDIWSVMPMREGLVNYLPANKVLNLGTFLPTYRTYVQYAGSLTTPPCTEGLLWHVLTKPLRISLKQLREYELAVGLKDCTLSSNSTNTTTGEHAEHTGRKMLHSHGHAHTHTHTHAHEEQTFVRGAYTGFKRADPSQTVRHAERKLSEGSSPNDYTCKIVSYGFTNRQVQPLNDRDTVLYVQP